MRMWMIHPKWLCRQHLLGEHAEIHKFRHTFVKQYSIDGRLSPVVQIEPIEMASRHNDLAAEMIRRGYKHESPYSMPDLSYLSPDQIFAKVDQEESRRDLCERCEACKQRIFAEMYNETIHAVAQAYQVPRRMIDPTHPGFPKGEGES